LWGTSYTVSQINASDFGVIIFKEDNTDTDCLIDAVSITVYYTANYWKTVHMSAPPVATIRQRISSGVPLVNEKRISSAVAFRSYGTPDWWDSDYYHRRVLTMDSVHSPLTTEDTVAIEMQTGYEQRIATTGMNNEAIQHSSRQIARDATYTYIVWIDTRDGGNYHVYFKRYNHGTCAWSADIDVGDIGTDFDNHYYPYLLLDSNGSLHVFYGCHDTPCKYRKSTNAGDTWSAEVVIGGADGGGNVNKFTYPRPIQASNGDIYLFGRGVADREHWGYYKSVDHGATWPDAVDEWHTVIDYSINESGAGESSCYCGGVVYSGSRVYVVICWWDWYGGANLGRAISCIYSDDFADWYNFGGTKTGTTDTDPVIYGTHSGFTTVTKIFESSEGGTWPDDPPYYITNGECLAIDSSGYPHFCIQEWNTAQFEACELWHARWSGSAWVKTNLSGLTSAPRMFQYRTGPAIYIHNGTIFVYAFVPYAAGEVYAGAELYRWKSTDSGANWSQTQLTKNTAWGLGAINALAGVYSDGGFRELIYTRGQDIFWLEDIYWPSLVAGGDDLRIIHHKKNDDDSWTTAELDRLPDRFNAEDTNLYFKSHRAVAENRPDAHAYDKWYLYYGKYNATNPPRDTSDVFTYFEGWEAYASSTDMNGVGGWTASSASKFYTLKYDSGVWSAAVNKLYSGQKSLALKTTTSGTHTLTRSLSLSNHSVACYLWFEDAQEEMTDSFIYIELYNTSTSKGIQVGIDCYGQPIYRHTGAGSWTTGTGQTPLQQYHKVELRITASGVSAWINGTLQFADDTEIVASHNFVIGGINDGSGGLVHAFFDHLIVTGYVSDPPVFTLGSIEGTDEIAWSKIHQSAVPQKQIRLVQALGSMDMNKQSRLVQSIGAAEATRLLRIASQADMTREDSLRLVEAIAACKNELFSLAGAVSGDKFELARIYNLLGLDKIDADELANSLSLSKSVQSRISAQLVGDRALLLRLGDSLVTDKAMLKRVLHFLFGDKSLQGRIASGVASDKAVKDRLSHYASIEATEYSKVAHAIDTDKILMGRVSSLVVGDRRILSRLASILGTDKASLARLLSIAVMDKTDLQRIAQTVGLAYFRVIQIAHTIAVDKEIETRLVNCAEMAPSIQFNIANALSVSKQVWKRLHGGAAPSKTVLSRIENALTGNKSISYRIGACLDLEASVTARLAAMTSLDANRFKRTAMSLAPDKATRLAISSALSTSKSVQKRIYNGLTPDREIVTRIGNMVDTATAAYLHLASVLLTDKEILCRILNKVAPEAANFLRLSEFLAMEKAVSIRVLNSLISSKACISRLYSLLEFVAPRPGTHFENMIFKQVGFETSTIGQVGFSSEAIVSAGISESMIAAGAKFAGSKIRQVGFEEIVVRPR
jgi:hypothetical protein